MPRNRFDRAQSGTADAVDERLGAPTEVNSALEDASELRGVGFQSGYFHDTGASTHCRSQRREPLGLVRNID